MWNIDESDLGLIESSFMTISEKLMELSSIMFQKLYSCDSELEQMFSNLEAEERDHKFISLIDIVISNTRDPEAIKKELESFSENYSDFIFKKEHAEVFKIAFIESIKEVLGEEFDEKTACAWEGFIEEIFDLLNQQEMDSEELEMESEISEQQEDIVMTDQDDPEMEQDKILQDGFEKILDEKENIVDRFHEVLFEKHQELKELFGDVEKTGMKQRLIDVISMVNANQSDSQSFNDVIQELGKLYQSYGALESHYPAIEESLINVLQDICGDAWSEQIHDAWSQALSKITKLMLEAYEYPLEVNTMSEDVKNDELTDDLDSMRAELEQLKNESFLHKSIFDVIDKIRAVVEFDKQGNVLTANKIFLDIMGYEPEQVIEKHHSMFISSELSSSPDYKEFWSKLNQGEIDSGVYQYVNSQGDKVYFQAYYAPIMDQQGDVHKVVVYATDITDKQLKNSDYEGQMKAINKTQAVIEFNMDGTIIKANDNFLNAVGYSLDEIKGKHHSMFVTPEYGNSVEYKQFWEKLNRGEFIENEFKRISKSGDEIWIYATYSPIMGLNGEPFKVVKYASDITAMKIKNEDYHGQIQAINKSQGVIEFNMDGTIIRANDNFLNAVGYSLDEIKGRHHSMFADLEYANSAEYKLFWEKLNRGEFDDGEYERVAKDGNKIWISASYNPIMDLNGKPYKVVKYATDITAQKMYQKSVENVLKEVSAVMENVANGDLTKTIDGDLGSQFNEIKETVNSSVHNLYNIVNEIRNSSGNINTSAQEIAQGNTDLSSRTEQQASALQETASTVEEMTGTVKQNADSAKQANQLATNAKETAEKGGSVVNSAVGAMSEINNASKKIADIIGVIDEIAFQTNLLALNAAVEAARAGEQGRGFAVVASEVRNLAQRSAAAAKEIKTLINDSVDKVEEGSRLVDESGKTLEDIVVSVKKVSDIIAEIAAAGEEQYVGIEQINKAVGEMDQMTQQNAALVEEAAAASQAMSEQSDNLNDLVSKFNVGESDAELNSDNRFEERRSASRPWNNSSPQTKNQVAPSNVQSQKVASSNGGDEWEEF